MKYKINHQTIPQEARTSINEKILYLINNPSILEKSGITNEDIFNSYTGIGGLHGLNFSDYSSFHSYTAAKKEVENGQFFTPHNLSKFLVDCLQPSEHDLIADLTSGMGNFFNYLPNEINVYGNEIEMASYKVAKQLYPNANITNQDIRFYKPDEKFDLIIGNPPFNLRWQVNNNEYLSQLYYCIKSNELLKPGGIMALIVPNSFLNDDFTDSGMIKEINSMFNFVCQFSLPANSFKNVGVNHFETKIILFTKHSEHIPETPYNSTYIESPSINELGSNFIHTNYIQPIKQQQDSLKGKLALEAKKEGDEETEFAYRVNKYLFDIKRNPKINKFYSKAEQYVNKYYTQEIPNGMDYKEWQKVRVTKNKVIRYLKNTLNKQHKQEIEKTILVKTRYGIKLKPYSSKQKTLLNKSTAIKEISFNDMILQNEYPFTDKKYLKLYNKKANSFYRENIAFSELSYNNELANWLNSFSLFNTEKKTKVKLFDMQKEALNKLLQKRYSMLNFQQGLGKTETAIAWYKHLKENNKVKNIFIISSSLSINLTWVERLTNYSEPFIKINSLKDISNIKNGDVVLLTFNTVTKYQKQLKKYIKMQSQKVALVVDESHRLSNDKSLRTKATLNVFRRVKYKLLATGTPTRNNLNELYPQMVELAWNNSINALCECEMVYKEDKITKELREETNAFYLKPFPANKLIKFKECFSPSKKSVFGIEKENQDIYNSVELKKLVKKFIITKKFKEVAGDKYEVITHRIKQNDNEKEVYRKIMEEFYTMIPNYFSSTGNSRKDSMLRIIRQLQLMIKATSIPHTMKEYNGSAEPNKYKHIENLLKMNNEKAIVGTIFIESCNYYYNKLRTAFPDRKIYLIQGNVPFKKRKIIIDEFEKSTNAIIITTQSSLSESVNIPSCNMVICEALPWNCSNLEQFYFRTIRIDSSSNTTVHLVAYKGTVEENILALLMSKERINEYIKTLEYKENADIFNDYGIDLDVFNNIITKQYDSEGQMTFKWGEQKII